MSNEKKVPFGSISTGTLRPQDLVPAFYNALHWLDEKGAKGIVDGVPSEAWSDDDHGFWTEESCGWIIEELTEALQEFAPPYSYFGAHEGDGADFGFWPAIDAMEDAVRDGELLKVSDTADVPDDYRGEVMLVNDHGNVTLYRATASLEEVWSIV